MTLIKKIIFWLIELFRSLFKTKTNSVNKTKENKKSDSKTNQSMKANINFSSNESLPSYMIISNHDKEQLIYGIQVMKRVLTEANEKRREIEEKKIIKLLEEHKIKVNELGSEKEISSLIKDLDDNSKKEIIDKYHTIIKRDEDFKIHLEEIDKVINEISNQNISIIEENEIDREISTIVNDKNISEAIETKTENFSKQVKEKIKTVDDKFLSSVKKEYQKVNYVTVSNMIIDKNYERFKQLEEDFKHHRFNKFYYEREINKIKHELNEIKKLKNRKEVNEHIEKLRKELYTKSKDKYDLLYNNEVFMIFNKECDLLLDKINTKVIDIKKEESKKEEVKEDKKDKEEKKKKEYLENILKRFQDMELARKLILLSQEEDSELMKDDNFINVIFNKYNNGIEEKFNFEKNRQKTELVILFNELNMAISKKNKEPFISIDHINFQMDDLVEAVEVKKEELKKTSNILDEEDIKMTDKIKSLVYKPKKDIKK